MSWAEAIATLRVAAAMRWERWGPGTGARVPTFSLSSVWWVSSGPTDVAPLAPVGGEVSAAGGASAVGEAPAVGRSAAASGSAERSADMR
jgi:hypothetical protein